MPQGWGRTPIVYLRSVVSGQGWTAVPEHQDPIERGIATGGWDDPDGWRDKEAWARQYELLKWWRHCDFPERERTVKRKVDVVPDVTSLRRLGYAPPPRGFVTRFFVSYDKSMKKWLVSDMDTGKTAAGTREHGYASREEAINVAEDLRDNRPRNKSRTPF